MSINIKTFITDLDGTLTDGGYFVNCDGCVQKKYNTRDFYYMSLLEDNGIDVIVLTSSEDDCDLFRMEKLGIPIFQGIKNKRSFLEDIYFKSKDMCWDDIFYVGDYLNDLECISRSRISASPSDACDSIKKIEGNIVLNSAGGQACVAEAISWYLNTYQVSS